MNSAPVFPSTEDGRREVAENSAGGTAVGAPVEATDLNAGDSTVNDPLAYSLSGTDAASFTIDEGTGQIRLAQDATLDYEGKRTYRVTVEVTDGRDQNGDDDMDAIDDRQNRDHHGDQRQRGARGHAAMTPPSFQEDSDRRNRDLHRRRPGARHTHLVRHQRHRLLDLQPRPAVLPHPAQLRGLGRRIHN